MTRGARTAQAVLVMIAFAGNHQAFAEIKDYEVLRFLYLKTPCGMANVTSRNVTSAQVRFTAECQNRTAFPDGAAVICTDHNDDRSCRLEKQSTDFKHLDLLRPEQK